MRQLYCNHAWYSGLYTLATRCHTCTAVTLKYTEASSLKILRHSLLIFDADIENFCEKLNLWISLSFEKHINNSVYRRKAANLCLRHTQNLRGGESGNEVRF